MARAQGPALSARHLERLRGTRGRRTRGVRHARIGAGAGARGHHTRAHRGGQEGRQARLLHGHGHPRGREVRQGLRGEVSRRCRARGALGLGAGLPAHRAGARQQHPCRRRGQQRGRRPFRGVEAQRLARPLSARGGGEALSRRLSRSRRRPTSRRASGCARSATTPTWSRPRRRPRALPTCSIPSGWAA